MKVIIEKGDVVEIVYGEGVVIPEDVKNDGGVEYFDTPFGIIKKGPSTKVTLAEYEARMKDAAEKVAAEKERLRVEAEEAAIAEAEAAKKAEEAWQLKYPDMRRSDTKPTEDPGKGFKWTNEGICPSCWTRTEV